VLSTLGRCRIDTCSDVSVARRDVLSNLHFADEPVIVGHMGGDTTLHEVGTLQLGKSNGRDTVALEGVFVVKPALLPAGIVALFGVGDIHALGISLDTIMKAPDSYWDQAVSLSVFGRFRRALRRCFDLERAAPWRSPNLPP
jgi:hypothetical protein